MGDGTKENPLTHEDVVRLIKEHGGFEDLDLSGREFEPEIDLRSLNLDRIILKKAILIGARLEGTKLMDAHLEEAILGAAHLEGALLGDAHLEGAELWEAHLDGAHLWGAEFSYDTRLESAHWGNFVLGCEKNGEFYMAEDTYRRLKLWYQEHGMYDIAAKFYYREKEANRKASKWRSKHWNNRLALEILRVLFGYGERWRRVLISIAVLILLFSLIYCVIGSVWEWSAFGNSLYFSAVSFTALGYGSWLQATNDWIKGIGAFESLIGVSMLALLLVTFFRKWTR